jgi:acetyl-CoA carboxylase carboxyl transferase subunit alpha
MEEIKTSFDFEKPIAELVQQIEKVSQVAEKTKVDMSATLRELEEKLDVTRKSIYSNMTGWQEVQMSRHSERPQTLDYISMICDDFIEMHGDRWTDRHDHRSPEREEYQRTPVPEFRNG